MKLFGIKRGTLCSLLFVLCLVSLNQARANTCYLKLTDVSLEDLVTNPIKLIKSKAPHPIFVNGSLAGLSQEQLSWLKKQSEVNTNILKAKLGEKNARAVEVAIKGFEYFENTELKSARELEALGKELNKLGHPNFKERNFYNFKEKTFGNGVDENVQKIVSDLPVTIVQNQKRQLNALKLALKKSPKKTRSKYKNLLGKVALIRAKIAHKLYQKYKKPIPYWAAAGIANGVCEVKDVERSLPNLVKIDQSVLKGLDSFNGSEKDLPHYFKRKFADSIMNGDEAESEKVIKDIQTGNCRNYSFLMAGI